MAPKIIGAKAQARSFLENMVTPPRILKSNLLIGLVLAFQQIAEFFFHLAH
jgi:hypothetical protein